MNEESRDNKSAINNDLEDLISLSKSTIRFNTEHVLRLNNFNPFQKMQKQSDSKSFKCFHGRLHAMLCPLLLISLLTVIYFSYNVHRTHFYFTITSSNVSQDQLYVPDSIRTQISNLQTQLGVLLEQLHNESSESKPVAKFSDQVLHVAIALDRLANSLTGIAGNARVNGNETSNVDEDLSEPDETEDQEDLLGIKIFRSGELRNYISPKPNKEIGKKNFLGEEAISPSIGLACTHMTTYLDRFMTYRIYGMCPDDWDIAQKLVAGGCEPLPRRRCYSKAPPKYTKPVPINSSLWGQPRDDNILWSHYKCNGYSCLVSNATVDKKGFYKCADCFNLSKRSWDVPTDASTSAEFSIDEVLGLKSGEIRIGLDFSPTTGTFAALMRERNVTIASATLNLGAPFSEVIALRGLLPLYVSVGSRLPFFDNTLDIVHSTLFFDGWIRIEFLQFVLFDCDRVLRPNGVLWIDRFFCKKEEMEVYLDEFQRLGYKKLLWRVVEKTDKLGDELFFSAVLEKPIRK